MVNIIVNNYFVHVYDIDSKNEMKEELRRFAAQAFLPEPESYNKAVVVSYRKPTDPVASGIGILCALDNLALCALEKDRLLIGYNDYLTILDLNKNTDRIDINLDSPFYFVKQHRNYIVVVAEISVVLLHLDGSTYKTFYFDDVITDYSFETNRLVLFTGLKEHKIVLL